MDKNPKHAICSVHFSFSDTPVTLKQSHSHQTYNENVVPEQGHNHAKFERSRFNSVRGKGNVKVFVKRGKMSIISLEHVPNNEK